MLKECAWVPWAGGGPRYAREGTLMKLRDRPSVASPLVVGLISGVLFGVWWLIMMPALGLQPLNWTTAVVASMEGLFFGAFMSLFITWQRKRFGGAHAVLALNRATKARQLPTDADPSDWVPLIERGIRQRMRLSWTGPVVFGLGTALVVSLALTEPGRSWFWWPSAVFMAAFAVLSPISSHREIGKLMELRRQLDARDAGSGATQA